MKLICYIKLNGGNTSIFLRGTRQATRGGARGAIKEKESSVFILTHTNRFVSCVLQLYPIVILKSAPSLRTVRHATYQYAPTHGSRGRRRTFV